MAYQELKSREYGTIIHPLFGWSHAAEVKVSGVENSWAAYEYRVDTYSKRTEHSLTHMLTFTVQ